MFVSLCKETAVRW